MTHDKFRRIMVGLLAASTAFLMSAAAANARAVALSDADRAPDFLRLVKPGKSATPKTDEEGRPCRSHDGQSFGYFSDVQAYRWNGAALANQRYDKHEGLMYWQPRWWRFAVNYDGLTFRNPTRHAVLVAGWCEDAD